MRDLAYWQIRGYPKGRSVVAVDRGINIKLPSLVGLTHAEKLQVLRKALDAGMGCKPMEAKRD
jgi:hypothetical protein